MYIKQGLFTDYLDIGHAIIIYNYFNSKVYKVDDSKKVDILRCVFNNYDIDELVNKYGNTFIDFFQELELFNLISIAEHKDVFHDDLSTGGCIAKFYSNNNKMEVRKLYVEIGDECDVNCNLCGNDAMFKCKSCFKVYKDKVFDSDILNDFICTTVKKYYCRELIFLGSEPLKDAEELFEIAKNVKRINSNIKIHINTPFSISNKQILENIHDSNIVINLQLVDNNTYYDRINILLKNKIQIIPIIRKKDDINLLLYLKKLNLTWKHNYIASDYFGKNKSLATEDNMLNPPSLEYNMLSKSSIKCLYGNMYIDIDGNIKVCKYYNNIDNIYNLLGTDTLERIWNCSANYKLENQHCITCKTRPYCNTCTFLTQKEKTLDCKYKSTKVL